MVRNRYNQILYSALDIDIMGIKSLEGIESSSLRTCKTFCMLYKPKKDHNLACNQHNIQVGMGIFYSLTASKQSGHS